MAENDNENITLSEKITYSEKLLLELHRCGRFIHHRVGEVSGKGSILKVLAEHPKITQQELLTILNIQPGSLSEILKKLENKGLIVRTRDPEDRRRVCVSVTECGLEMVGNGEDKIDKNLLFVGLTDEERQQLLELLTKLTDDWHNRFGHPKNDSEKKDGQLT